jgi:uncharacterized protein YfeS
MIKALEDVNLKLDAKIRKENDEVIFEFNHTMMETMNKISKQVVVEVNNHLDEKEEKESKFRKIDLKQNVKWSSWPKQYNIQTNPLFELRMI